MRTLLRLPLWLLLLWLAYLNYQLYYQPQFAAVAGRALNQDVLQQARFLKPQLHQGAADDMQQLFPEGFVYLNALYGLTWLELAAGQPAGSMIYNEGLAEAAYAIRAINSPTGYAPFEQTLPLPYGAYYQGWSTYLLGRYLAVQPPARRTAADITLFEQRCARIAQVLAQSTTPYPESYSGAAWPADGVMCIAALAWHDRTRPPRYQPVIRQWLLNVDTHLDSLQLIPHSTDARTGLMQEAARGSSQSQLLNFLIEIDSAYAQRHFERYRRHFLTARFGLPGVREAAEGAEDVANIDSGPVLLGVGGAASIVGRRTFQRYGDATNAVGLRNSIEAFGFPLRYRQQKRYLLGALPIADAFIAWSNSLEVSREASGTDGWRGRFQVLSVLAAAALGAALLALRRRR